MMGFLKILFFVTIQCFQTGLNVDIQLILQQFFLQFIDCLSAMKNENNGQYCVKQSEQQSKKYLDNIKHFLQTFKTNLCTIKQNHNIDLCPYWHTQVQKRRNPYIKADFAYYPFVNEQQYAQNFQNEKKCQNQYEKVYHPLLYKTQQCINFYNCEYGFICPRMHVDDKFHFQYHEFFRFDLQSFKTRPCNRKDSHQRKICIYYHNDNDRRRSNFEKYNHIKCINYKNCEQNCIYSHNKIQQLYHPNRYKTKFCKTFPKNTSKCQYRNFCSFAHVQGEIQINLIHLEVDDANFYVSLYKTIWCPFTQNHQRSNCVYAHNFQDFRRDPHKNKFIKPQKCPYWNFTSDQIKNIQQAGCKDGLNCNKCHGWMQHKYHPQVYKKNKCKGSESIMNKNKFMEKRSNVSQVGAPFFEINYERQISEASRRTEAKTVNVSSERSMSSNKQQVIKSDKHMDDYMMSLPVFSDNLWKNNEDIAQLEQKEQSRAKSLGRPQLSDISYSKSVKDMFQQTNILNKCKSKNITEFKIINIKEDDINKFNFLTSSEKQILARKIKEYSLKRDPLTINYSPEITKFFVKKNCFPILQKMRNKRVKQIKLLNLVSKEINEVSFLTEEQKKELPQLLRQFSNEKQFLDLNELIKNQTKTDKQQ